MDTKHKKLSIIINLFNNRPKSIFFNKTGYLCGNWGDVYANFLDYIETNYEEDFQSILSDKIICSDLPTSLKADRGYRVTNKGLYIRVNIGRKEILKKMNLIVTHLGAPTDCIELKEMLK